MPNTPKRPCAHPGCGVLVERGRCEQHKAQQQRQSDQHRGNSSERGYTWRWRNYRRSWLRAHPLCGDRIDGSSTEHSVCLQQHRVTAALVVDHIKPHRGDDGLFWDPDNHQSLCESCHNVKTATEDGGFGNRPRNSDSRSTDTTS